MELEPSKNQSVKIKVESPLLREFKEEERSTPYMYTGLL